MSDYFAPPGNNDNGFVNGSLFPPRDEHQSPPSGYHRDTSTAAVDSVQSRCVNENDQKLLTWNISLTDDQDVVSERFLRMHIIEPTTEVETFGPAMLTVPENIRKQADELFKPSEINLNEIYDLGNTKVSWILPTSYQQYLKSIPPNVLGKGKRHVLYPWTQWKTPTGTWHRPSPNSVVSSPVGSDLSSLSSSLSSSSVCAHVPNGRSFHNNSNSNNSNNNNNNSNNNSNSSSDTSFSYGPAAESNPCCSKTSSVSSPQQRFAAANNSRNQRQPVQTTARGVRSPSVRVTSSSSSSSSPPPPPPSSYPFARFRGATAVRTPSRLYYCVRADTNTINKVVEHYCTFCYKNHEPPEVYGSHLVRDATRTTCPKLRALRCKHCNGTGDNAHTIKYCPFLYANYG